LAIYAILVSVSMHLVSMSVGSFVLINIMWCASLACVCYSVFVMMLSLYQLIRWLQLVIRELEEVSPTQFVKLTFAQNAH